MANKQKKKRNKVYRGPDAATNKPVVTKISAVSRSKPRQWWLDNKRLAKPVIITVVVALLLMWLIYELIRIASS